jgi:hypothetical protein
VIRLNPAVLSRYGENIAADHRVWTASRRFANNRGEEISPLLGFDPAAEYLADLQVSDQIQHAYASVMKALIYVCPIALVWSPCSIFP